MSSEASSINMGTLPGRDIELLVVRLAGGVEAAAASIIGALLSDLQRWRRLDRLQRRAFYLGLVFSQLTGRCFTVLGTSE